MQTELLWNELLQILQQLDIEVRWSSGEFRGGLYSSQGVRRVLLNEGYPTEWQVSVICQELSRLDLSKLYICPAVRDVIESQLESGDRDRRPPVSIP